MNKHEAIYATHSTVVTIRGDVAYDQDENIVEYNEATVQAYIDAHAYKSLRQAEYPSYADQFDTIFHQGIDAWKAQIQAVKDKYPKG
jgi:predicted lipoprotein